MASEKRSILLACVTLTVYAFSGLLQQGKFLYPFPLNEFIFLGVGGYIGLRNFKQAPINYGILLVAAGCFVACRSYNWNLFLSAEAMSSLVKGFTTDVFYLLSYLALTPLTCRLSDDIIYPWNFIFYLTSIAFIGIGSLLNLDIICALGILLQVKTFYSKENTTTTPFVYLYCFLAFLFLTKEITLFLS